MKSPRPARLTQAGAEAIAVQALSFLAADMEELGRFLSLTGLGPENLRHAARQPDFLAAVMAHLAADERLLLAFAEAASLPPAIVGQAAALLAGPVPDDG